MANLFDISTVSETIKADENGNASSAFTVTNKTAQPIRGIAKVKPLGNTMQEWLSIEGEAERDFSANGTQQFSINFSKPSTAPADEQPQTAEEFKFRFDVISSQNPDEDFTEGPEITVEIPKKKVEEKSFPIWIPIVVGIVLLAVIGGVVGFLLLRDTQVTVPDVVGDSFEDAKTELEALDLVASKDFKLARGKPSDEVLDQDPKKDEKVDTGTTVTLTVPLAKIKVPKVVGDTFEDAKKKLEDSGLKVQQEFVSAPSKPDNIVMDQNPPPTNEVDPETIVKVKLPKKKVKVPNLKGLTFEQAKSELKELGLSINRREGYKVNTTPKDIYAQNPSFNTEVESGKTVTVFVSLQRYRVKIDCRIPFVADTQTSNRITVSLLAPNGAKIRESSKNKISDCNQQAQFALDTNKPFKYIKFQTNGNDAFLIDRAYLFRDNVQIKIYGVEGVIGWCLSTDQNDKFYKRTAFSQTLFPLQTGKCRSSHQFTYQ